MPYWIIFAVIAFTSCSSSKLAYLYDRNNNKNIRPAIVEIKAGEDHRERKPWTKSETAFGYEIFGPIYNMKTWVKSIDGTTLDKFVSKGHDPSAISSYKILPGKHQIEFFVIASGPYESSFSLKSGNSSFNVSSQSSYNLKSNQAIQMNAELNPGDHYVIENVIKNEFIDIKMFVLEEENMGSLTQTRKRLIASATGEYSIDK